MITFDDDGLEMKEGVVVGDYVRVLNEDEMSMSTKFIPAPNAFTHGKFHHVSGYMIKANEPGREGYVTEIFPDMIPVLYVLDSGPRVPLDAIKIIKKLRRNVCECGKDKFHFVWHSDWCSKYESPYSKGK